MNESVLEKKTGLYWLWLAFLVIIIDQFTKYIVLQSLEFGQPLYVLPFFNLLLEHNKGAAFSFLSEAGSLAVWVFVGTAFVISMVLCYWLYRLPARSTWLGVSLALILGGAIGNLIDRIMYGYVVDFLQLHIKQWSWPIFNIADTAITIGSVMLLIDIFKKK